MLNSFIKKLLVFLGLNMIELLNSFKKRVKISSKFLNKKFNFKNTTITFLIIKPVLVAHQFL